MSIYKELVGYLLPEGVLDYFELERVEKEGNYLHIYIEEKDVIPEEYSNQAYRSNGFLAAIKVKDFPLREHFVTLYVKRRRWLLLDSKKKVKRDWSIAAPGTRITKGFAAFLKELAR